MKTQLSLCLAAVALLILSDLTLVQGQNVFRRRGVANSTPVPLTAPYRRLLAGESTTLPPANVAANTNAEPASTTANVQPEDEDGFAVVDGVVYLLRGGKRAGRLENDVVLRISPNGVVTGFDGRKYRIPPDEMLRMDGQLASVPGNSVEPAQPAPPPSPPENPTKRGGRNTQNTSK
jgi:hypothetical protein